MKSKEIINYERFDNVILNKKFKKNTRKPFFTLITKIDEFSDINLTTIISVLNQNFIDFKWLLFIEKRQEKKLEQLLENNDINDSRIKFVPTSNIDAEIILSNSDTQYFVNINFGAYIVETYLETIYANILINNDVDLIYTNSININEKKKYKKALVNKQRRIVSLFTETYVFNKKILNEVLNDSIKSINVVHLNYYGVYEKNTKNRMLYSLKSFQNYPDSCLYNYDSEPTNLNFKYTIINKNKNILCFMPWAKIGGADIFNLNIINHLKEKGYNVYIITTEVCDYEARERFEEVVEGYYDLTSFLPRKYWADFIKSFITNNNIELIFQMNSVYTYHLIPWIKYHYPKLPIIEYLHAEDFAWRNGGYPKDSTSIENFIDKTYTCNKHLKELMIDKMNRKDKNISTLYIGVDTNKFDPSKVTMNNEEIIDFCKEKKVLIFPSRFSYEKRPLFLLNVMNKIKNERKDIVCLMVGDGEAKQNMSDYINRHNLNNIVKLIPMQKDIRPFYKISDLTIICSLSEGITLTTYESLSMNIPVISADVGGQKEIVNRTCGEVVKTFQDIKKDLYNFTYDKEEIELYKNAIYKILDNPNDYKNCREIILNNYSQNILFKTIEKDINYYISNKSTYENNYPFDENFAIRYLVLYNEISKLYFNNSFEYDDFKQYIKNKLWSHSWWRIFVKVGKKLKLDKIVKKIYFKEQK